MIRAFKTWSFPGCWSAAPIAGWGLVIALCALQIAPLAAQQVTTSTPNTRVGHSFNENFNFGFNARFRGDNVAGFINNPGGVPAPFGGFDPQAGTRGGIRFGGDGFVGNLNFSASQGSSSTLTSTTPSVTTLNGQPGMISDQVQVPFVIGVTPVVNGRLYHPAYGLLPRPLPAPQSVSPILQRYRRLQSAGGSAGTRTNRAAPAADDSFDTRLANSRQSSAGQGAASVAEIRRQQQQEQRATEAEALHHFQRGQQAEADGKLGAAKIFYRMAARQATRGLKQRAEQRLYALQPDGK